MPHFILRRADIVGVQSYIKNIGGRVPIYFIEISLVSGHMISSDYDERDLWVEILTALESAKIFAYTYGEQ